MGVDEGLWAIDARVLKHGQAGRARYTQGLIEAWIKLTPHDRVVIYLPPPAVRAHLPLPPTWAAVTAPDSILGSLWIGRDAARRKVQALLGPTNYSLGALSPVPTVTIVYDLAAMYRAEHRPSWRIWLPEWLMLPIAVRRARHLIAISKFTKQELIARYPATRRKTDVVYGGVDERFFLTPSDKETTVIRNKYDLPDNFLLFVGTLEPRKNLVRLLQAYGALPPELQDRYPLYLAGNLGWSHGSILEALAKLEARGVVRRLGYVDDDDLPLLYHLATITLYPSLYEGFGLPALEALAAGGVVLTSKTTALPEVVGRAALMVDPTSTEAIREGISALVTDQTLRTRLKEAAPRQATKFTWRAAARQTRAILQRVAKDSSE